MQCNLYRTAVEFVDWWISFKFVRNFFIIVCVELEERAQENQERIAVLQRKIAKLTKSHDDVSVATPVEQTTQRV